MRTIIKPPDKAQEEFGPPMYEIEVTVMTYTPEERTPHARDEANFVPKAERNRPREILEPSPIQPRRESLGARRYPSTRLSRRIVGFSLLNPACEHQSWQEIPLNAMAVFVQDHIVARKKAISVSTYNVPRIQVVFSCLSTL